MYRYSIAIVDFRDVVALVFLAEGPFLPHVTIPLTYRTDVVQRLGASS